MVTYTKEQKMDKVQGIIKNYLGETYRDMGCPHVDSECEYNAFVLREHLDDVLGFIEFAKKNDIDDVDIRITLAHDIGGLKREEDMFLPRVSGYGDELSSKN